MIKFLSFAVALAAPLAVSAQFVPVTTCDAYVFTFGSDIYQCGARLSHPVFTAAPDACDHGSNLGFRPLASSECNRLITAVQSANYSLTNRFSTCRGREAGILGGDTLSNWGCYNTTSNVSRIMTAGGTSQTICNKTRSYFTMVDPMLAENQKCGCGSPSNQSCSFVEPGFQCLPGLQCVSANATRAICMRDPMADHACCHSLNHAGPAVRPGTCCLGSRVGGERGDQCVLGREFKNVTYTGIPNCTQLSTTRKTQVMEGNLCLQTPPNASILQQGDCMEGLRCQGLSNNGFCVWWDRPDFHDPKVNMKAWEKTCEPNDCRVGTYCHRVWNANNEVQFSQCRPLTPGMNDTERHDGLITNPAANRIYRQKLGNCTGVVGTVWGDPHVITYDKLTYDCMGAGDYVLTENCLFRMHARLDGMESKAYTVSQSKAMALQTGHATPNDKSDDSLLQMYFPENWFNNKSNILPGAYAIYQDDCPLRILHNGIELPRPPTVNTTGKLRSGQVYFTSPLLNMTTLVEGGNYYYVVDYRNGGTARFRVSKWSNGCMLAVDLCLPQQQDNSCYKDTVGMLGTPNADRADDWHMITTNKTILGIPRSGDPKTQWNYCTKNWCVTDATSILPVSNNNVSGVWSSNWYNAECLRPYPGDVNYTFCYDILRCDKFIQNLTWIVKGVTPQKDLPPEYRACCINCLNGPNDAACIGEEKTILQIKESSAPTPDGLTNIVVPPAVTCSNLGNDLSGPTGPTAWTGDQGNVRCADASTKPCSGLDNSYSVFVGGDLTVKRGQAIEGRTYVGGTFSTEATAAENDSLKYMGWAPCGSQMCPHTMTTALEACGNVNLVFGLMDKVEIMMMEGMSAFVRYGGSFMENGKSLNATVQGSETIVTPTKMLSKGIISRANAEQKSELCFKKDQILTPLKGKATFWAGSGFKNNAVFLIGTVTVDEVKKEIVLDGPSSGNGCTILIDLNGSILDRGAAVGWKVIFGEKITPSQTVLINVSGKSIAIKGIAVMEDKICDAQSTSGYNFDNKIMVKTLWNFFEATSVSFGSATVASSLDWQGSILAPLANVNFYIKSHLGRMVVGGSLTVDHPEATFYNYMFNPKGDKCELPPPPTDNCVPVPFTPPLPGVEPSCVKDTYISTELGSTVCIEKGFSESIIKMDGALGYDGSSYTSGRGIFYGLKLSPGGSTVQFNVNNPFTTPSDIYVKHESFFQGTTWLDPVCEATFQQPTCLPTPFQQDGSRQFEVSCSAHGTTGKKSAQVYVYFATQAPEVKSYDGTKLAGVDKCCHPQSYNTTASSSYAFVEFMFKIDCECPVPGVSGTANRQLRGNL